MSAQISKTTTKDELLSLASAASLLGVTSRAIRVWVFKNLIEVVRIGPMRRDALNRDRRTLRFRRETIESLRQVCPAGHVEENRAA